MNWTKLISTHMICEDFSVMKLKIQGSDSVQYKLVMGKGVTEYPSYELEVNVPDWMDSDLTKEEVEAAELLDLFDKDSYVNKGIIARCTAKVEEADCQLSCQFESNHLVEPYELAAWLIHVRNCDLKDITYVQNIPCGIAQRLW